MTAPISFALLSTCIFSLASLGHAQQAIKPPMGWNSWNSFATNIDEDLIKRTADALNELGLVQAGYNYLNLDDAWHDTVRSADGQLQPHPKRFASGIPSLVKYAQERGLKLGIYTDVGVLTCAGYPGSHGHEAIDAKTFASWGISYVKVDNCWADQSTVVQRYTTMGRALNATGQPMVYSLCSWGVGQPWRGWGRRVGGNSWRTSADISPTWGSILMCLDSVLGLSRYAGPEGWNDPDMLEVGNADLTIGMQRAHFALWALVKAPLLIGADLQKLATPEGKPSLDILKAREVIAINQDELGVAGDLIIAEGTLQVWAAPLVGGARAVVFLNRGVLVPGEETPEITVPWQSLGWDPTMQVTVRDLYKEVDLQVGIQTMFSAKVPAGDCLALKLTPDAAIGIDRWRPWRAVTMADKPERNGVMKRLVDKTMRRNAQRWHQQKRTERMWLDGMKQKLEGAVVGSEFGMRTHVGYQRKNVVRSTGL